MATHGLTGGPTIPKVAGNDPDDWDSTHIGLVSRLLSYCSYQLDGLSECLEQVMEKDAKKVHDDYYNMIKTKLLGILPDDDDVNQWMMSPEKELTPGFDKDSDTALKRANFFRRDFHELHDLSVLIMKAPINKSCPTTDYLDRSQTDQRCREFINDKHTGKVSLVAPDNRPGGGDRFRIFDFKLSDTELNKILEDLSHMMQRVDADYNVWDLRILYGKETRDEARPNMYQEHFKLSASAQVDSLDLFDTVRTEIKKFHMDIDKDRYGRQLEAEDYIRTVRAVHTAHEADRVTNESVTSTEEVTKLIADFMRDKGVKSKTALVIVIGHGCYPNGDLCLDKSSPLPQMTVLDTLYEHRDVEYGVPHSIDVVWGSCYSYTGIPTQQQDDRIQVIQRRILPEGHLDGRPNEMYLERVTLVDRPLRSYHLTCEGHKMTWSIIEFNKEATGRGDIKTKVHTDLRKFGERQNTSGYNMEREVKDVFAREQDTGYASC